MTVKGGTTPACAACKFQRRKCTPNCPLAPYFPANQPKMFQNVHRLFGVSNITKTLSSLKTKDQKEDAMKSIIYEAEMRERFPVYGCSVIIRQLDLQLQYAIDELRCVYAHLSALRAQSSGQVMVETGDTTSVLIHSPSVVGSDMAAFAHNTTTNNQFLINDSSFYGDSLDYLGKPLLGMDSSLGNSLTAIQSQMDALNILQQDRGIFPNDFEGVSFNSGIEERSYIDDTRDVFESTR